MNRKAVAGLATALVASIGLVGASAQSSSAANCTTFQYRISDTHGYYSNAAGTNVAGVAHVGYYYNARKLDDDLRRGNVYDAGKRLVARDVFTSGDHFLDYVTCW